jgi:hypothetical protein
MAGRFKRKPDRESPVGDLDQLDIIAKRRDGGVDLFLVVGRPLDLSKATRDVFARKFRGYCRFVTSPEFEDEFGPPSEDRVCIAVSSDWEVPDEFMQLMLKIAAEEDVPAELAVKYE